MIDFSTVMYVHLYILCNTHVVNITCSMYVVKVNALVYREVAEAVYMMEMLMC